MPGITQTIPNYGTGGISEQPDQLKRPGELRNIVNAIPDVTWGLYKRPASRRVEAAAGGGPLANLPTHPNNGTFFHYYRDETEGSYIGHIANNGVVRVWDCDTAAEVDVQYERADGTIANYDSGDSRHTSIRSYLNPSGTDPEDLQTLTINDSTFVTNRTKQVKLTGTTTDYSHTNCAFLEILRTENGRQYALNVYDTETTRNIHSAARVKISADNLQEGDGTGTCKGIGTQVFSGAETDDPGNTNNNGADDNRKNLTFRITVLGQQGLKAGNDETPTGDDYQCSYNREVTLLHGGEGWTTNDHTKVTMTSTDEQALFTVKVTERSYEKSKGYINSGWNGQIRPKPTPFDSDTAVTSGAILGDLREQLTSGGWDSDGSTGLTCTVIGNGIYMSSSNAFTVEVLNNDLMRVMQKEVNDVTKLPVQCKYGYIVKVANSSNADEDDYYLKFVGTNGLDGAGSWVECPKPGIDKSFNASTMPHVIQRQSNGKFLVKRWVWADRENGDNGTNPAPSFCGPLDGDSYSEDRYINKVLFFRNRIAFLSGENVICSRPGTASKPNFWAVTALAVSPTDPIDIACASTYPSDLYDGIETNTGLLCFSTNQQFLLSADDTVFTPDTAKLRSISNQNYNKITSPIDTGYTVGFLDNSNKYSRFVELADIQREREPTVVEMSKIVPTLLSKDLNMIANSIENSIVLFADGKYSDAGTQDGTVVGFKYYRSGVDLANSTATWFKWKFYTNVRYHFCVEDQYYWVSTDGFLNRVSLIQ